MQFTPLAGAFAAAVIMTSGWLAPPPSFAQPGRGGTTVSVSADSAIDTALAQAQASGLAGAAPEGSTNGMATLAVTDGIESATVASAGGAITMSEPSSAAVPSTDARIDLTTTGARALAVLRSAEDAAQGIRFTFNLPPGGEFEATSDSGIDISLPGAVYVDGDLSSQARYISASVRPAWAIDASGRALPTWYSVEGSTLVQHVATDESTTYPVVADPSVDVRRNWPKWSYVVSRDITGKVARNGPLALGALAIFSGPAVPVYVAISTVIVNAATNANDKGNCLELHAVGTPQNFVWADTYSGTRCKTT